MEVVDLLVGCVLFDLWLFDFDGLEVQYWLGEFDMDYVVVFLMGFGEVFDVVFVMCVGVVDFLCKFYCWENLFDVLGWVGEQIEDNLCQCVECVKLGVVYILFECEFEVLCVLVIGKQSKVVVYELGLSIRMIDMYCVWIIKWLNVFNIGVVLVMVKDVKLI